MIRKMIYGMTPRPIQRWIENRLLHAVPRLGFDQTNLISARDVNLSHIFSNAQMAEAWRTAEPQVSIFDMPDGTGGVNPGDRRAVFYLISHFRPRSVLEVGTHIGASTIHVALALSSIEASDGSPSSSLVSVDVLDVNDPVSKPWLKYGTKHSPREMIQRLQFERFVEFVARPSLDYIEACKRNFDLIFLDGSHSGKTVYQEVSAALKRLNPGGVILLHDYFPDMRPLWSNGSVISGPFLAIRRMQKEGVPVKVLPFGALPWPTKCDSTVTSLALLTKDPA